MLDARALKKALPAQEPLELGAPVECIGDKGMRKLDLPLADQNVQSFERRLRLGRVLRGLSIVIVCHRLPPVAI
jgi:hypothetical protein